ncbi:MAG: hypothetical protein B0D92_06330 [Spirochaeta sp. LUC14_002_19_P3]|nr:MAG: hypothetical protein B0D92_06330 [Spirochaeta sp. LUC14_002_19_P3]
MIPLLQINFYQTQANTKSMVIMGGITFGVIVFLVVFNKIISQDSNGRKRFNKRAFRREMASIGLSAGQAHLLEHCIKQYKVRNPFFLLKNSSALSSILAKAFRQLSGSQENPASIEKLKLNLYRILQKVDIAAKNQNKNQSTRKLSIGDSVKIKLGNNKEEFESNVTENTHEYFVIKNPYLGYTSMEKRLHKGKKVILIFLGGFNKKISFETKIMGLSNVDKQNTILLEHTTNAANAETRKYRRCTLNNSCTVQLINTIQEGYGRKAVRKAVITSGRNIPASMLDISSGGCAFEYTKTLAKGQLLKITLTLPTGDPIEVFGRVCHSKANWKRRVIVNVQFTRASTKNLNKINGYCYDLG